MKRVSMIVAALAAGVFASSASAMKQQCSLQSLNATTGQEHNYAMEVFFSNKTGLPYHIEVVDVLGRVETFDNNSTTRPTIVEVTDGADDQGNYFVEGKDGTPSSILIVYGKGNAVTVLGDLPALGFKHSHSAIVGTCK